MTGDVQLGGYLAIAQHIAQMQGRVIVAIDGVDGAGKTTLADTLKPQIEALGKPVLRASVDGFHNPRVQRYAKGRDDPKGYFLDSFNTAAMLSCLVLPFRQGAKRLQTAQFDYRTDQLVEVFSDVPENAALLIDGIFLHRDELFTHWDFSLFLEVPFEETFRRMALRDGLDPDPRAPSNRRYHQGQLIYFAQCKPHALACLVLEWPWSA